jgi:hypothetical protein
LAALHALAAVAGAERPERWAKLLPREAESALRVAVFEGEGSSGVQLQEQLPLGPACPSDRPAPLPITPTPGAAAERPGATPADVFASLLEQPFLEQRVAAYRCLAALAARDWAAAQVCSHEPLLARLADPRSESGKRGCEWRHACVAALAATTEDVAAGGVGAGGPFARSLLAAAPRIQAAMRAGPYGAAGGSAQEQQVATLPGP